MEITENQRLKILMRELEFKTQKSFADALKLQPGTLSDIFREKPGVGVSSNTKRILENSYNVNIHWLETGDGEPTIISKSGSNSDINNIETPTIDISEQDTSSPKEKSYVTERKLYPLVPMYNFPASASVIEMYNDPNDIKVVGHLSIPGSTKKSFALPVYGHSMYPTLENGAWCVLRPIENANDILWGEIYYIEWGDYRNFKRLLASENEEDVILWSDNQSEVVNGRPKYSPVTIKKESIRKLCLLTDILKKPNY